MLKPTVELSYIVVLKSGAQLKSDPIFFVTVDELMERIKLDATQFGENVLMCIVVNGKPTYFRNDAFDYVVVDYNKYSEEEVEDAEFDEE